MYIGDGYTFGANAIGEKIQGDGFRLLAAELGSRGVHRVFSYELVNGSRPGESTTNAQNSFGCYRIESDGRWTAKPLFYPVRDTCRRG